MSDEKHSFGERRLETELLYNRLMKANEGETITYQELNQVSGVNVQNGSRHLLNTARKQAEAELRCLFSIVRGVGLKRCPPGEQVSEIARGRDAIRRKASRTLNRSKHVDYDKLDEESRARLNAERTLLHFAKQATTKKAVERIEEATKDSSGALGFEKTLEFFKKK